MISEVILNLFSKTEAEAKRPMPSLRLFFLLWVVAGIIAGVSDFARKYSLGGDLARLATAESLVERGTFAFDDSHGLATVDKVYVGGRFYGCQMPFMSMMIAAVYFILYHLGLSFARNWMFLTWLLTWIFSGACVAGAAVILGKMFARERKDQRGAVLFAFLFFFGTLYLSYSVILSHHIFAGFLIILAYYLVVYRRGRKVFSIALAGVAAGAAAVIDPPAGIAFSAGFLLYLLIVHRNIFQAIILGLAALPPLIAHAVASINISGAVFPPNIKPSYFDYYGSIFDETNLSGVVSNDSLRELATYSFHCFLGHRGLFIYTPLLVFALWGLFRAGKNRVYRNKAVLTLLPILLIIVFYLWRTQNYGGDSYGVRFFLPFTPVLFGMMIFIWDELKRKTVRWIMLLTAGWSFIFALVGIWKPASDSDLGLNSFAVNLFQIQTVKFPRLSSISWPIMARLAGDDSNVNACMGRRMWEFGEVGAAEKAFRQSLSIEENQEAYLGLGDIYLGGNDYSKALRYYRAAYRIGGEARMLLLISETFTDMGEPDSSNFYLKRYISIGDSISKVIPPQLLEKGLGFFGAYGRDKAVLEIVENYLTLSRLDSAEIFLREISPKITQSEAGLTVWARFYARSGDSMTAVSYLEKALQKRTRLYHELKNDPDLSELVEIALANIMGAER